MKNQLAFMQINHRSVIPKYQQLANQLLKAIELGNFRKNELMPSIHELCISLEISKGSVEKAYKVLKAQGFVGSFKGKGYYLKEGFTTFNDRKG